MLNRLQFWFARQPLTLKLLVAVPVLVGAVGWAMWQPDDVPADVSGNRPVLARQTPAAGAPLGQNAAQATPGGTSTPEAGSPAVPAHVEPQAAESGFSVGTALRTVVSVVVVVVLIVFSGRFLKYFMANATGSVPSGKGIRLLETVHVPAPNGRGRAALHLVEVGERLLIVGATDTQLTLLSEFEDEALAALLRQEQTVAPAVSRPGGGATPGEPVAVARLDGNAAVIRSRTPGDTARAVSGFGDALHAAEAGGTPNRTPANGANSPGGGYRNRNGLNGSSTGGNRGESNASSLLDGADGIPAAGTAADAAAALDHAEAVDESFGQRELAAMLERLRASKARIQSDS